MKAADIKRRFIDKFFSERELVVEYDEPDNSAEKEAHAWFNQVQEIIAELPTYRHDNVGQPLEDNQSDAWFFRGHKDSSFAFTSTLYRRLVNTSSDNLSFKNPDEIEEAMLQAELSLLNKARKMGIGRGLTALETLTLLQHHGSPTRLIDVTSDWKVALFFACESDDDRDGRMFLIKTDPSRWRNFPKEPNTSDQSERPVWHNYRRNFDEKHRNEWRNRWRRGTWPILLPFSDPRMISQRGFFLVGGVPLVHGLSRKLRINVRPGYRTEAYKHPHSEAHPRAQTIYDEKPAQTTSYLSASELRDVTSMAIRFETELQFLAQIGEAESEDWPAVGYSIRIPGRFKRTLRDILRQEGVHKDSIYPPLRETVRLFEHVVDESLKRC